MEILIWSEIKDIITRYNLKHGRDWLYTESTGLYKIFAKNCIEFICNMDRDGSADVTDFETNFKTDNIRPSRPRTNSSPRPKGTTTYFPGIGDNSVNLQFDLTTSDANIVKILTFTEDIYLKDALIITKNAPIESYIEIKIVDPGVGDKEFFLKNYNLLGNHPYIINSEDDLIMETGLELHVTVFNATPKQAFKVVGNLEMYRQTTI